MHLWMALMYAAPIEIEGNVDVAAIDIVSIAAENIADLIAAVRIEQTK